MSNWIKEKPNDWLLKQLGDIGESIIGLTYSPSDVVEEGTLVLRSSNVGINGTLKFSDNVFVKKKIREKLIAKEGDILICVRNGSRRLIGKCALIKGDAVGETFGAFMSIFRSNYNKYVFHLLQSDIIHTQIAQHIGATINQITNGNLNSFKIPFPPLPQQTKIAKILTTLDNVIEKTEATIAKYEAIKQGMMQDLFTRGIAENGQLRPTQQEAPALYKQSALGWIPKEWEVKQLVELCSQKPSYGVNAAAVDLNSKYPNYLRITDIDRHGGYSKTGRKCVNHPLSFEYILKEGDIVFARTGATVGKTYLYNFNDGVLVYAGFLIKVSPNKDLLNPIFLKFYTETSMYNNWVVTMSQRSGQPGINGNEYGTLGIPTPFIKEQRKIITNLLSIHNTITQEILFLSKQQQLKQGLMQDLLTGKVAV